MQLGKFGLLTLVAASLALAAAGCSSADDGAAKGKGGEKGGTVLALNPGSVGSLDPQRNSEAKVFAFGTRTVWRNLTTTAPGTGELVGDLATDTGTPSDDGRNWSFTIREGVKWQDGKELTCDDVRYGMSRSFATDQITGGSSYALRYLDIPADDDGQSKYRGPYSGQGQELFDDAVSCDGSTLTIRLKQPSFDFNQALSTSGFAAYRKDQDKGAAGNFTVFSAGPYMLQGEWKTGVGGTFVRNPHWNAETDPVRKAYPDQLKYEEGLSEDAAVQRIIADSGADRFAISQEPATPAQQPQLLGNPQLMERTQQIENTGIDFLQPNFQSDIMSQAPVRQALAMSTDRAAYARALGGVELRQPTFSVLHHGLAASSDESPFGSPLEGAPEDAKQVLEEADVSLPVAITVAYKKDAAMDKAMAALAQGWEAAGFAVTLKGNSQDYYGAAAAPSSRDKYDVFWNTWGQAWPSAATIIPNLFDSRLNLSASGTRLDYGYFDDDEINERMDETKLIKDDTAREESWGEISFDIAAQGGYIALVERKSLMPMGSGIVPGTNTTGLLGQVDLADLSVR